MDVFFQALWGGTVVGVTYAVLALGFTLIFGVLGVLQFSHPQIFVAGGFVGYAVQTLVGGGLPVVLPATMIACAAIGLLVERVAIRPLKQSSFLAPAIATIAAGIAIQNIVIVVRGPDPVSFPPLVPPADLQVGGVTLRSARWSSGCWSWRACTCSSTPPASGRPSGPPRTGRTSPGRSASTRGWSP